jgi:hypothetical protein
MTFPATVTNDQAYGVVGDIVFDGPQRAESGILNSTLPANNVIGRAFGRKTTSNLNEVEAGGTGVFAGILFNSKSYATSGTAAGGSLAPTLTLPNETQVELLKMGTVLVSLTNAAAVGNDVHYVQADGTMLAVPAGTTPAVGNSAVPFCKVVRLDTSGAGLTIIQLTN